MTGEVDGPVTAYTPEQLSGRLREIEADAAWSGPLRTFARYAARSDAAERGFAITPADLSDQAVYTELVASIVARGSAPKEM
jgi:hypothetical protein